MRGLAIIAEIIRCFDVIALQEVRKDTSALGFVMDNFWAGTGPRYRPTSQKGQRKAGEEHFILLSALVGYGSTPAERQPELVRFATHTATEIRDRTRGGMSQEEPDLMVLGDFNITNIHFG